MLDLSAIFICERRCAVFLREFILKSVAAGLCKVGHGKGVSGRAVASRGPVGRGRGSETPGLAGARAHGTVKIENSKLDQIYELVMTEDSRTSFSIATPFNRSQIMCQLVVNTSIQRPHLVTVLVNRTWRPRHPDAVLAEKVNVSPY